MSLLRAKILEPFWIGSCINTAVWLRGLALAGGWGWAANRPRARLEAHDHCRQSHHNLPMGIVQASTVKDASLSRSLALLLGDRRSLRIPALVEPPRVYKSRCGCGLCCGGPPPPSRAPVAVHTWLTDRGRGEVTKGGQTRQQSREQHPLATTSPRLQRAGHPVQPVVVPHLRVDGDRSIQLAAIARARLLAARVQFSRWGEHTHARLLAAREQFSRCERRFTNWEAAGGAE